MKTIVFVDDNPDFLDLIEQEFADESFAVKTILDKPDQDIVAAIRDAEPTIIFLDIYLISAQYVDVCKRMQADQRICNVPVYLMTYLDQVEAEKMAHEVNAYGAFSKPFSREEVHAVIVRHFPS